jgi:hypothetical protein
MKCKTLIYASVLAVLSVLVIGQTAPSVVGKWQGDKHGSPLVTLNISRDSNGALSGTAVFFILERSEEEGSPKILGKQEVQLLNPKLEGNVLSFQISNQHGQVTMNPSSGETLGFRMTLNSEGEGILKSDDPGTPGVKMVKQK